MHKGEEFAMQTAARNSSHILRTVAIGLLIMGLLYFALPGSGLAAKEATPKPTPSPTCTPPPVGEEVPEGIAAMIRVAQQECFAADQKPLPKSNKYSQWYFNDKRQIGWCSNFVSWCADQAGVTLLKGDDSAPVADDAVFVTNEAKVVLTFEAYQKAERITDVPKPGYEVIYGVIGGTSYTHVGMVESVIDLGDGVYELTTVEGNVSSSVKRYCYRYVQNPKTKYKNFRAVPKAERTRDDAQYKLHKENWFVTGFGQTWK